MASTVSNMEELAWYRQLGAAVCSKVAGGSKSNNGVSQTREEPREWRCFELADAMEQGLSNVLTTSYIEPAKSASTEQRLLVRRSDDSKEFTLMTKESDPLLVAKANSDGTLFSLYIPSNGEPPCAFGPAFLLSCNSLKDHWTLKSASCENCESKAKRQCGTRTLANIFHYYEQVGDGQAFCMDVDIPEVSRDGCAVWCSVCGESTCQRKSELTTRRPKWNPKQKSLTLDFRGRCSMASAKNFQLERPSPLGSRRVTFLLFGKIKENEFVLDYKAPLGMVQAFASALTTSHWK